MENQKTLAEDTWLEEEASSITQCCGNYTDVVNGQPVCRSCQKVVRPTELWQSSIESLQASILKYVTKNFNEELTWEAFLEREDEWFRQFGFDIEQWEHYCKNGPESGSQFVYKDSRFYNPCVFNDLVVVPCRWAADVIATHNLDLLHKSTIEYTEAYLYRVRNLDEMACFLWCCVDETKLFKVN